MDGTYQPWSKAKYAGEKGVLNDRYKIAAGMEWQPNPRGGYFRRMHYRVGAHYNRDYLRVRGNDIRDYGVGAGVGFPRAGLQDHSQPRPGVAPPSGQPCGSHQGGLPEHHNRRELQ